MTDSCRACGGTVSLSARLGGSPVPALAPCGLGGPIPITHTPVLGTSQPFVPRWAPRAGSLASAGPGRWVPKRGGPRWGGSAMPGPAAPEGAEWVLCPATCVCRLPLGFGFSDAGVTAGGSCRPGDLPRCLRQAEAGGGTMGPAPGGRDRAGSSLWACWQREGLLGPWCQALAGLAEAGPAGHRVTEVAGHAQGFVDHCQGLALPASPGASGRGRSGGRRGCW